MPFLTSRWAVAALPLLLAGLSGDAVGAPPSATPAQDPETYAELKENDLVETSHPLVFPFAADDDTNHSLSCAGM